MMVGRFDVFSPLIISLLHGHRFSLCMSLCGCARVHITCRLSLTLFTLSPCPPKRAILLLITRRRFLGGDSPVIESVNAGAGTRRKVSPVCERATKYQRARQQLSGGRRSVGCLLYEAPPFAPLGRSADTLPHNREIVCCCRVRVMDAAWPFRPEHLDGRWFYACQLVPRLHANGGASAQSGRSVRCDVGC